ncbi:Trypsin and DDE 1 domain containing protein [Trichuris trichiura]|uniref:Trypsin and DDE 1 domain containing protein n=1 Tax=Trichuris trichiura TaxID=36087 RepID=A0A077ZD74_TRITR|nr:Trypsin and DDE 1 domain containing protein [Trichuris trichiura]
MIPAEMTAYLQTLDIGINKPFKNNLRSEVNSYIENKMERNQRSNFTRRWLEDVVNWMKNSWDKITDSYVANALRAGYLDKKCSFKESFIATHERLGSMVLQEMESQKVQAGIQNSEIYEDVPENADVKHSYFYIFPALFMPIRASCGDVNLMKDKNKNSAHRNAVSSFPWDVLIATKKMGSVRCIGSLIHQYPLSHYSNISDLVVTAGKCFRRQREGQWLDVSGRIAYVAPGKHSFRTRTGIQRELESGYTYPISNARDYIRDGTALLKLKQPVPLGKHAQAICLPEQHNSLPRQHAKCFYSRFYKTVDRIYKEKVALAEPVRCYEMEEKEFKGFPGICTQEKKKRMAVVKSIFFV